MGASLIETSGGRSRTHVLAESPVRIGRGPTNDVVLATQHVSADHLEITWAGDHHVVRDLGSKNGTLLNGERLSESRLPSQPSALDDGDELLLGGVSLIYRGDDHTLTLNLRAETGGALVVDRDRAEVRLDGQLLGLT